MNTPQQETQKSIKEGYYAPYGNPFELNNTGLSGSGPAWGPKQKLSGKVAKSLAIALIIVVAILLILLLIKTFHKSSVSSTQYYYF